MNKNSSLTRTVEKRLGRAIHKANTVISPGSAASEQPTIGSEVLESVRRQHAADLKFLKSSYTDELARLTRRISQLERENFELRKVVIPFPKESYRIDGKFGR